MRNNCAIILAGGNGTRFGSKKQFIKIDNKPLWEIVYKNVSTIIPKDNIVVVGLDIEGGLTRSQSVINGLNYLKEKNEKYNRIIILEAARPLVTVEQMLNILNDNHKSCTYVLPLVSTIIKKDGTYVDRNDYYRMSTPVVFDYALFSNAYLGNNSYDFTDDTRVMYEEYGIKPYFFEGSENLLKLTYPSDLPVLEMLYKKYLLEKEK